MGTAILPPGFLFPPSKDNQGVSRTLLLQLFLSAGSQTGPRPQGLGRDGRERPPRQGGRWLASPRGASLLPWPVRSRRKTRSSPHLRTRSSQVYIEDFTGFGRFISSKWSQQHLPLSRPCPWKGLPLWERWGTYIPRTGEGVRSLPLPGSRSRVNPRSRPLHDLQH